MTSRGHALKPRLLLLALAVLVCSLGSACGSTTVAPHATKSVGTRTAPSAAPSAPAPSPPSVQTVHAATAATVDVMATSWVAEDRGLFHQYGLNVPLDSIRNGSEAISALLSGQEAFLEVTGSTTASAAVHGAPVAIVATLYNHLVMSLVSAPGITSGRQLAGKTIGISAFGSQTQAAAELALRKLGLTTKEVTLIQLGSVSNAWAALRSGHVAAATLTQPFLAAALSAHYVRLVNLADAGPWAYTGITTTEKLIRTKPNVVLSFVKAQIAAAEYIRSHEAGTVAVLGKYLKSQNTAALQLSYRTEVAPGLLTVPLPTAAAVQPILQFLSTKDAKAKSFAAKALIAPQFVQQLVKRGFTANAAP